MCFESWHSHTPCSLPRMPADLVKERERKWLKMLAKWDYYMERKPRKVCVKV